MEMETDIIEHQTALETVEMLRGQRDDLLAALKYLLENVRSDTELWAAEDKAKAAIEKAERAA